MWSVKCEVWSVKEAVRSEKCGVWSVKCGVWSLKFGVRRVQCAVWGVECRGKDTVGTGCLWTIGHLFLGNFRRRLARVYVMKVLLVIRHRAINSSLRFYLRHRTNYFPSFRKKENIKKKCIFLEIKKKEKKKHKKCITHFWCTFDAVLMRFLFFPKITFSKIY